MNKIAVVGGGPAGLLAAGTAARFSKVVLFERNDKLGKKLYITGKGRCNFTNDCTPAEFISSVVRNPKFLYGPISKFSPQDAMILIQQQGIKTKVERGNRVFPLSDKASDITKALTMYCKDNGVEFRMGTYIREIKKTPSGFEILTDEGQTESFISVILACGGKSYPSTGSDGNGYALAKQLGHEIIEPRPSLVDIKLCEDVSALEGLSLKNVNMEVIIGGKSFSRQGEMLFTSDGVSGPIALTISALISREECNNADLILDLKPALGKEILDKRILYDFSLAPNKCFKNSLNRLLPQRLVPYIIGRSGINTDKPVNSVTKAERAGLIDILKGLRFKIDCLGGFERAVVTSGGVNVKQINPSTMESKICSGLYFAGEMMDIDAFTGGFNIQIAMSTGYVAGYSAGGKNG